MSGADFFSDQFAINALMDSSVPVSKERAVQEHTMVKATLEKIGVKVIQVPAPPNLQDGVYTANWALVRNGTALMARLPNKRQGEEAYALEHLQQLGMKTVTLPESVIRYSGQGDSLPCGDLIFTQSPYRTAPEAHSYLTSALGYTQVIRLQTKPSRWWGFGPAKRNKITGWPDSPTYDIDLALAILRWPEKSRKGLIAWCPAVFTAASRATLTSLDAVDKIEVSYEEAMNAYALNLVSTGEAVVMNSGAPNFQAAIEAQGLHTFPLDMPELKKGGGSIRCITLTLDNP